MKRRLLWLFLLLFLFVGCDKTTEVVTTTGGSVNTQEMGLIEFRVFGEKIQWKYEEASTWTDLVALSTLTGPAGEDGKAVMFRLNEGYIQWQRDGDSTWNNLFNIDSLEGLGIESMLINELGELVVTYTDDSVSNLGELNKLNIVQFVDGYGRVVAVHLVKDGGSAIPPILPPMPGHTFLGWNESYDNIMVDTSVYALYSVNSYNITFNPNGGENVEGMVYEYGEAITLPIPLRFGYRFMGWYMGETANSPKATDGMVVTKDLSLYARWQKETAVTVHDEEELIAAVYDPSVEEIVFGNDITSSEEFYVGRSLIIDGNGYTLYANGLYGVFRISTVNHNFASEYAPPSGGSFEVRDLEIIADSGIPDYEGYSAFAFERVHNMDVRFINISVKGVLQEGIGIYESTDIDFKLVDSFFDVVYSGIGGFMNEGINISIVNSTIKSHFNLYLADLYNSTIDVYDSEFYVMNYEDEYGVGFINFGSGYNDYNFYNTNFYVDEIIDGGEGGSGIIVSVMEGDLQQAQLYNCHVETNNPYYDQLFYSEGLDTSYYMVNSTLEFVEGITNIGDYTYRNMEFSRIILPDSLESIGIHAFESNYNLVSIVIPEGVTTIGDYAFAGCSYMGSVVIPSSVTYVGMDAFIETNSSLVLFLMEGVDTTGFDIDWVNTGTLVEEHVQEVGKIDGITYVGLLTATVTVIDVDGDEEDIIIPKTIDIDSVPTNVKAIHAYAFANNSSLKHIYIPNTVEVIGDGAFYWAENLRTVTFEENSMLTTIGYEAFIYCENLSSITIPASVIEIGEYAFSGNYRLKEAIFEEGINLLYIPTSMFEYCESLEEIIIPATVIEIGINAFNGCMKLKSVIFEEGSLLTTIEDYAFNSNYSLTEIYIPETVTLIGAYAFANSRSLTTVDFGSNPSLITIDNYAFSQDSSLENIYLPETVTSIGNGAFRDCEKLTSINIPSGITLIPNDFCFNCDALEELIFPLDSQVTAIGTHAFYGNDMLNNVVLPEGLTSLSYGAFSNCYSLESIIIPAGVTSIPDYAFSYNESLTSVTFASPNTVTSIGMYAFNRATSLGTIELPVSVTAIKAYAFNFCISMEEIFISDLVLEMGNFAFNNCPLLTINVEHASQPAAPNWSATWLGDGSATVNWAVNHRTITLELDNGEVDILIYEKIGTPILQPADPVKVDYTFIGWFVFDGTDWVPYTFSVMPEEDITIKAFWVLN